MKTQFQGGVYHSQKGLFPQIILSNNSPVDYKNIQSENQQQIPFLDIAFSYIDSSRKAFYYKQQQVNVIRHVGKYCELEGIIPSFLCLSEIDSYFVEGFVCYLTAECKLMMNTIKGYIEKLQHIISELSDLGYQVNPTYRKVDLSEEETSGVYLSYDEILKIYFCEKLTRLQREIRDLFVLACFTGFRYSDYSQLKPSNFDRENKLIRRKTKKTGKVVVVPMNQYVVEIYDRYGGVPKPRCNQWFDKSIKNICKKVGLKDKILWERTVGGEVVVKEFEKWEMVASHTARRSFATNAYKAGVPTREIMQCTGHTSESSFFRYIRVTPQETVISLMGYSIFR